MVISSALRLDKTSVRGGETLNASVTYRNTSSSRIEIWTITIAGRKPGATHTGGPYDDFSPSLGTMWLEAGASVTLNASRAFSATDTAGRWEAYSTYQDSTGWHDGPSVFFDVNAPTPPSQGVAISSPLRLDKTTVRAGETLNASVTYRNNSSSSIEIWTITIAGRRPGATHTGGPYDDFSPSQGAITLQAGASVTLNASRAFSAADATGQWESYSTYQDNMGAWHDGPSVFFAVAAGSGAAGSGGAGSGAGGRGGAGAGGAGSGGGGTGGSPPPITGAMKNGTNFWYHTSNENNWSGETSMKTGINWATAYGAGTNGLAATNIWNDTFVAELAKYTTLRFMDWGATNHSQIVSWSQRMLPTDPDNYEIYIDAESPPNTPGMAYEWMIDLSNRLRKDIWICLPAMTNQDYWTQLATLIKNKLQSDRRVYIEYSNETWNGTFTQFDYVNQQGVANNLPGGNKWYQGQSYTVWQALKVFQAFENVFGKAQMGTRVIRVFAYGGNLDTGRQAMADVYKSSTYNPTQQTIDMLSIAPYIGSGLDGAAPDIQSRFHHAIDEMETRSDDGELGAIAWAVQDKQMFGIAQLGTYEGGQHLYQNAIDWTSNPRIYTEYMYMLDRWSNYFTLFLHYSHTGTWTNAQAWGAVNNTGQPLGVAHKYRALLDWITAHP